MPTDRLNLIGAGGHASVVMDALIAGGTASETLVVWSTGAISAGGHILGRDVHHLQSFDQLSGESFHLCIGDNAVRESLYAALVASGARAQSVVHPAAVVSSFAKIDDGAFIGARAIVAPRSHVGASTIINHAAVVDHDCIVADFAHVAPAATLGGGATVGRCVLIGAGANVLPRICVGDHATVGAGSVVLHDVPPGSVLVGVPAKPARRSE